MGQLNRREFNPNSVTRGYTYQEDIPSGETGSPVIVPPLSGQRGITLKVIAGAGTGRVEYTTSPDKSIKEETANWDAWDKGDISGTETDVITSGVTAIRGASVSGDITFEVCI